MDYGSTSQRVISKPSRSKKDPLRKKILLMGTVRGGKTSCLRTVYHDLPPNETLYLDPTVRVDKNNINTIIPLQIWDCPGSYPIENLDESIATFSTIIYVIDIQDDYTHPIAQLIHLLAIAYEMHPTINLEVFLHKSEGLSPDYKNDSFRMLQQRIYDETYEHKLPLETFQMSYHLTSVYDHSIYEAWSRVIQRLIEPLPTLENLVNVFCVNSDLRKAYLFDVKSLTYIATESGPPDFATHALCCEYIQTLQKFSDLYKNVARSASIPSISHPALPTLTSSSSQTSSSSAQPVPIRKASGPSSPRGGITPTASTFTYKGESRNSKALTSSQPRPTPMLSLSSSKAVASGTTPTSEAVDANISLELNLDRKEEKSWGSSCVRLKPQTTLVYWEITEDFALVALVRAETYDASQALIDYNVTFFRKAIQNIVEMERAKFPNPEDEEQEQEGSLSAT